MKTNSTLCKPERNPNFPLFSLIFRCVILALLFVGSMAMEGYAQTKEYATVTPSSGKETRGVVASLPVGNYSNTNNTNEANVVNASAAADMSDDTYATLEAGKAVVLGTGYYGQAWVQLKFDHTIPANTPSYIRIGVLDKEGGGLDVLGKLTGDILGLITNEILVPSAYKGASAGDNGQSVSASTNILHGEDGFLYAVVTPTEAYNSVRIRIRNANDPLLGLLAAEFSKLQLKVYNAFHYDDLSACDPAAFADLGKSTGLSVKLKEVVKNPEFAVNGNTSNYSEISTGTLSILASASQNIYFPTLSEPNSILKVRLAISSSTLDASLLGAYHIRAYNGNMLVEDYTLQGGLINNLDLLGLLGKGGAVTIPIPISGVYDRVEIGLFSTVGLTLDESSLRLYGVSRTSASCPEPPPTPSPLLFPQCIDETSVTSAYVDDVANLVDGNFDSYASIRSGAGVILGIGEVAGYLDVGFGAPVPAGKTTYIRFDYDEDVLDALIAGSLGNTVTKLLNGLALGDHYFTIDATSTANSSNSFSGSSADSFADADGKIKIVQDSEGRYYIAIKSDAEFNRIRITDHTKSVVGILAPDQFLNIYNVCYEDSEEICDAFTTTSYEGTGITLDLLNLGSNGVTNAQYAIDGDEDTHSNISLGAVSIAGSIYQNIHFNTLSNPEDHFRVKMKFGGGTVSAEVLGHVIVKAFDGEEEVYSQKLSDGLISGLDLLDLINSGDMINIPFGPGVAFDRVAIGIESVVSANVLNNPLELYNVERFSADCPDPELVDPPVTEPPFNEKDCGTEVTSFENVNFPLNVVDNKNDTYATLTAGTGLAVNIGAFDSHLELSYPAAIPAHEVSYMRINMEEGMLNSLLGGSLGGALSGLLGSVALGNQYFEVEIKDAAGARIGNVYSSSSGLNTEFVKLVKDANGRYYLAITADEPYQSVRISHKINALLGFNETSSMQVYSMCRETEFDPCEQATFTSWDGTGVGLDIANLTNGGVNNPEFAIDEDNSNYSTLNTGVIAVGASVSQTVYFKTKSGIEDELRIKLQLDMPTVLDVDLLGSAIIRLFDGENKVYEQPISQGIVENLDLLGLFNSGGAQSFTFEPGVVYDRVQIEINSVAGLSTSPAVRFYGVSRITEGCPDPDVIAPPYRDPVCADDFIDAYAVDDIADLFDGNHNSYASIRSGAGILLGIGNTQGRLQFGYGVSNAPANRTSYIRISEDSGLLDNLLSGSLGDVVGGLVNGLALGNHYFTIDVHNAAGTEKLSGNSRNGFADADGRIKIVQDKTGRFYIAIQPDFEYNNVEIKTFTEAVVGVTALDNSLNVYGMCFETDFDGCAEAFTTSWDGSGLNVGVSGAAEFGVIDAFKALDNNNNDDYSTMSLGALSVAGTIQQNVQFNKEIDPGAVFKIKMEVGAGTVDASVFGRMNIVAYKNGEQVYSEPINNAVVGNVNLATLFDNGGAHEFSIALGETVDEVALQLVSLVGVTVIPNVRLYYIQQDCGAVSDFVAWKSFVIDGDPTLTSVSGGETVEYTIHVRNDGTVPMVDYIIEDVIPAKTEYVSGGTNDNGTVIFENINIAPGAEETVSFKVLVDEDLTGVTEIINVALLKSNPNDPGTETFPPSDTDPNEPDTSKDPGTIIPVDQVNSLVSWKAYKVNDDASVTEVEGGETIEYTIFVRNTGNQELINVKIEDALPTGVTLVSGQTTSFTIKKLAVGATSDGYSFKVTVDKDLTGIDVIHNVAVVEADDVPPTDSHPPVDNTDPKDPDETKTGTDIDVVPVHDIDIALNGLTSGGSTGPAVLGEVITYTITVTNTGNKDLKGVDVSALVPEHTTFDVSNDGGTASGDDVNFPSFDLEVGETLTFTYDVVVGTFDPDDVESIDNTAIVTFRNEGDTADKTKPDDHSMVTDCMELEASDILLSDDSEICESESITLDASLVDGAINGAEFLWFTNPSLTGTPLVGPSVTVSPTETTTYYVIVNAEGYCFQTPPATITVTVNPLPEIMGIELNGITQNKVSLAPYDQLKVAVNATGAELTYTWEINEDGTWGVYNESSASFTYEVPLVAVGTEIKFKVTIVSDEGCEIVSDEIVLTVEAQQIDYSKSNIEVIDNDAVADGIEENRVRVNLLDKFDKPVADADVVFEVSGLAEVQTSTLGGTSDAAGQFDLTLTSEKIGTASITATADGKAITVGSPAEVTFVAGAIDYDKSKLVVVKDGATADGVDKNILEATIVDAFDNPIANADVDFSYVDLVDGTANTESITTDASGKSVLELTSTKIGEIDVTAEVLGAEISGSPATVTFVAGAVDYDKSKLVVVKDGATADGIDKNILEATIVDAFDNRIANADVDFSYVDLVDGTAKTENITTDANGKSVLELTSTKIGEIDVTAEVLGTEIDGSPAEVTFVAGAVDYDKSKLVVVKDGATADGVDKNILEATIVDAFDNPIANAVVDFSYVDLVDGTTKTENITTDAYGKSILELTSTKIGEIDVTAEVLGTEIDGSPATVTFFAGDVDYDKSKLIVVKDGATADGVDKNILEATIVDAFDNPIADTDVDFSYVDLVDGTTKTANVTTDANGKSVLELTSMKIGEIDVTAEVLGTGIDGSPATVTFVAGDVDYDNSNLKVTKDGAVADGVDYNEFTATIVDKNNNPIADTDVVFNITNPDGSTGTETVKTDGDGIAVIPTTSTKAGEVEVEALVDGKEINNSPATAIFVAGDVDYGKSNLKVTKDNAVADGVDYNEFTATIVDAFDNPIVDTDVVFNITNPDGSTGSDIIKTDGSGIAVIEARSTTAGEVVVDALVDNTPIANSPATATFVIANNISIEKVANELTVKAGSETTFTVTLTNDGPAQLEAGKVLSLGEMPSTGLTITGYETTSGNATAAGNGNNATVTTDQVVAVGGTVVVKVTALVAADAPENVNNGVKVWGPDKDPATDPEDDKDETPPIPVEREFKLSITKEADEARVKAGESTTFTLTITNNGPATIASGDVINLTERPGDGVTITGYEVTSGNGTAAGTGNSATVTTSSAIAVGGTVVVKVTADVSSDAPATITNGITVWGPDKDPETDPEDDKDDTPPIPVDRESQLSIMKVADEASVKAGESTTFTLTITNDGPAAIASGEVINLTERPSAGVTITGYEVTSGNGAAAGTGNKATVTTSSAIAVGGTITVKVSVDVHVDAPATITNGITVWGPDKDPGTDPEDDKDDTPEIPVDRDSQLSITKVADEARVQAGESTSFTLTITNNGPAEIASGKVITLTERPGNGVTITGYEIISDNGTANGTGNSATVTTNKAIAVGGTITVKVTADVHADAPATITNGITVWGPDKDPETDPEDDKDDTPETPVDRTSNLSITKVADEARVKAGESTTFTLTITNNGPAQMASGKVINLIESPGGGVTITGYEVTSDNGVAVGTGNNSTVTTNKAVAVGETIVVKVNADIAIDAPETITNGITVWGPDKDPETDPEDDKDDTPEIPVDFEGPTAADDVIDVKAGTSSIVNVLANDIAGASPIDPSTVTVVKQPTRGVAIVNADGTVTYTPNMGQEGIDEFSYQVKDENGNLSNVATVTVTIIKDPLFIPNTFTPNGDGLNDVFVVKGLDQYSENELIILNRWGNQVYMKRNYANDWTGEGLNEGTYFYVIKVRNLSGEWEVHKGHIALIRITR